MESKTQPNYIPPPQPLPKPDQSELLSVVSLSLAKDIRATVYDEEHVVVKYTPARTYLALTPAQWKVLKAFADRTATVPQVLFELISDRRCIPLREFYEIIIKAYERGILQAVGEPAPAEVPAEDWTHRASGRKVRPMVIVAAVGAVVSMVLQPFALPTAWWELLVGWLIACVAASSGYFLSACVARDEESEIYHPGWRFRTLFPRWNADLHDAVMGGRETVVNVALARIAPLLVAMGIVPFLHPGISFLLFCAFIYQLSPFWWSPGLTLLHARYGKPSLDAFRSFIFEPNRNRWFALRTRLKHTDLKFLNLHLGMTAGWLLLVLLAGSLPLRANALELWQNYQSSGGLHFTALAMLALLGFMVVGSIGTAVWLIAHSALHRITTWINKSLPPKSVPLSAEALQETISSSLLFKGFGRDERARIAEAAAPVNTNAAL